MTKAQGWLVIGVLLLILAHVANITESPVSVVTAWIGAVGAFGLAVFDESRR